MKTLYIGLMSGTSLDGVDGVLTDLTPASGQAIEVLAHASQEFDAPLRTELLALNSAGDNELHRAALAANRLSRDYSQVVSALLQMSGITADQVAAIGAHGQTVRHRPGEFDGSGYTIQIFNPSLLAELTGIAVVADFRSRDVAAGGQGAPLVPAFHRALFGRPGSSLVVLNVGGISNLSLLHADGADPLGFDCGPGNVLMDLWCQRHLGQPYDDQGRWAASGMVLPALLDALWSETWLRLPPPKSTGRDLFNAPWLESRLGPCGELASADVQATLCEFTASVCASHLQRHAPTAGEVIVCGGGARNAHLMGRLQALLPGTTVADSSQHGLPPQQVEAAAFAWLAGQRIAGLAGNLASVTGARGPRVLGGVYAP